MVPLYDWVEGSMSVLIISASAAASANVRDRHRALLLSWLLISLAGEVPNHS
jgi:hypothetical protein